MNILSKSILTLSLLGALVPATLSLAEDTDIYAANNGTANNPNVLVIIDNSANWNANNQHWPDSSTCTAPCKQGKAELNALRTVIGELGTDINLGLMMFTSGATDGAYPRYHIRQMTSANKTAFQQLLGDPAGCAAGINSLTGTSNCIYQNFNSNESGGGEMTNSASTRYSSGMFEAYKYFGGYTSPAHATDDVAGTPTDTSHFGTLRYTNGRYLGDAAAYTDADKTNYNSPLSSANSCAKNYVIFIGNGYPSQDAPSSLLTGVAGNATQLPVPDFNTVSGVSPTLLSTNAYASQSACETAAAATYGVAYDSYSCSVASSSSSTATTTLSDTSFGAYADASACTSAETAANASTYDSVTCTASGTATGTTTLTDSACGIYANASACTTAETTANAATYPGGVACTQKAGFCSYTTATGTQTSSCRADVASCNANAATDFPGSPAWSSRSCGAVVTANCTYAAAATQTFCATNLANCNTQATAASFNAGFTSNQTATNCVPNVGGSKQCNVSGTKNVHTGNTYTITGITTNTTGLSFSRVGSGAPTYKFSRVGSKTTTTSSYNIYGNKTITTAVPTGTYTGVSGNYADEWAKYLYQTDVSAAAGQQNIRTYGIDVFKDAQDANETKLLMSMANQGGGKYFSASDENSIKNALRKIFSEIQSVNSVFASSSLPVSVNTQGTYLNQVFIGMFRPDGSAKPRWAGNLKQYQFAINAATSSLFLSDKNGDPAISATTGFITPCADSIWTTDTGNYWQFGASSARGSCGAETSNFPAPGSSSVYSDAPDGDVVEKGGAAQKIRGVISTGGTLTASSTRYAVCAGSDSPLTVSCRKLLTCNNATCSTSPSLIEFSTANAGAASGNPSLTAASLGTADDTERNLLIDWVRGKDIDDENANTVIAEVRPSAHGAVVHSQPAVIDYGGATGVYAFYGADDGVFHAVNGDKDNADGTEAWGFIAPESYGRLKRFRSNDPLVNLPGVLDPTATPKSYFFDGSIGAYQKSGTVWIYPTMRRGGRAIYAFDVSTPTAPTLKWRKGCFTNSTTDDSNCSSGWSGIGQTWSKPQTANLTGYVDGSDNPKPVLVFGGGYDTCEDVDGQARCGTTPRKGANIWFVDADTGTLLRTYSTNYSVAGDVFLSKNASGYVTAVHAVDTGGYVYRIDVGSTNSNGTTFTSWSDTAATDIDIANLSETNQARKFLFGPDVVQYPTYTAVMVGTGDREHAMLNNYACGNFSAAAGSSITNQFFMVKETADTYPASLITPSDLTDVTSTLSCETAVGSGGWRFTLGQCEQVVNKPLSIGGVVYFGTNQPSNAAVTACSTNLGIARGYAVKIENACTVCDGCSRSVTYVGGGLPPSPVAGVVEVDGVKIPFLLGGSKPTEDQNCVGEGCSSLGGGKIEVNPTGSRSRVYWFIQTD